MKRVFAPCLISVLSFASAAPAIASAQQVERAPERTDARQILNVEREADGTLRVDEVLVRGTRYFLRMKPHSQRAADFRVFAHDGKRLRDVPPPPCRVYRGELGDQEGNVYPIAGSVSAEDALNLYFSLDGEQLSIEPEVGSQPGAHVIRAASEASEFPGGCGAEGGPLALPASPESTSHEAGTVMKVCKIAFDTDFEYFVAHGQSEEDTVAEIEMLLAGVSLIYETFLNVTYEVTAIVLRETIDDPYVGFDAENVVHQFRSEWLTNMTNVDRNVAQLVSGKFYDDSVFGWAFFAGVCTSLGYGMTHDVEQIFLGRRIGMMAHELGHNWDARHCQEIPCTLNPPTPCFIMCACIAGQGCSNVVDEFTPAELTRMVAWRNSHLPCMEDYPGEVELAPFFSDRFLTTTLDRARWPYAKGAVLNSAALNPSDFGPALNLSANGSALHQDHEIRTNELDLASIAAVAAGFSISYSTEHRGVESGEQLVVEYYANDRVWRELARWTSDGVDQSEFEFHAHAMPADAIHAEFRVRFRTEVDQANDEWFIDMVRVGPSLVGLTTLTTPRLTLVDPVLPVSPGKISIASAGDRNGDGRDDFLFGNPSENQAFVISGLDGATLTTIDCGGPATQQWGWSIANGPIVGGCKDTLIGGPGNSMTPGGVQHTCGMQAATGVYDGDQFGWSVAALGADLNGDGTGDYIVGAPALPAAGLPYVRVLSGADNAVIFHIDGANFSDGFGYSVASAGDVNGDGTVDILVGAPMSHLQCGSVRVFSGTNGSLLRTEVGAFLQQYMGWSVCGVGDIDGDGKAEFAAGAPGRGTSMGTRTGTVIVFSGETPGSVVHQLFGSFDQDNFGWSIDAARDIDRDGVRDILVGAPAGQFGTIYPAVGPGTCHLFSGANGKQLFDFRGEGMGNFFGAAVAHAGRVKKKGDLQVILGAFETGPAQTPKAYVITIPNSNPNLQYGGF